MENKETIGQKIQPILKEIEDTLWEFEAFNGSKPCYPEEAIASASKIFISVLMDKMWELQEKEKMDLEDRSNMAEKLGGDIKSMLKTYLNVDSFEFYKK